MRLELIPFINYCSLSSSSLVPFHCYLHSPHPRSHSSLPSHSHQISLQSSYRKSRSSSSYSILHSKRIRSIHQQVPLPFICSVLSRIGGVSAHKIGLSLVGIPHFYNSMLMNGGCTSEQDNKDKWKKNKHLIHNSY